MGLVEGRGRVSRLLQTALVLAMVACLGGCSGLSSIKNPFKKAPPPLPGVRIPALVDQDATAVDKSAAGKPVVLPAPVANSSWTQPGGNPANSLGNLAFGGAASQLWSASAGTGSSWRGRLSAIPLVADGKVFTLDAAGDISAFSADGGAKLWATSVTPENERSTEGFGGGLALDGNQLYATTGYGTAAALNAASGEVVWTQKIGNPIRSSPTAVAGKLYFVSSDSVLHCLNGSDGSELWTARGLPEPAALLSNVSPAVGKSVVIAAFPAGDIGAYQINNGESSWTDSLTGQSENNASEILNDPARPVIDRDMVFAVGHGGKMIAASQSTGERLWTRNLSGTQMPWPAGDSVFVLDVTGKLIAMTRSEGKIRWLTELPNSSRWSGPVLAGGKLWAVSGEGLLVGADAKTGTVDTKLDLGTPVYITPVVAAGRMYILTDGAKLIALD